MRSADGSGLLAPVLSGCVLATYNLPTTWGVGVTVAATGRMSFRAIGTERKRSPIACGVVSAWTFAIDLHSRGAGEAKSSS